MVNTKQNEIDHSDNVNTFDFNIRKLTRRI